MTNLSDHFGTDASLDTQTTQDISRWLQANAGGHKAARTSPPEDRITQSRWFKHEHDEVAPDVWLRPTIKSASNCMACHTSADRGEFDEDDVRIPR
jgi:nitrate/TMAO reductase-like tetraheme cytochrome c subunit